MNISNQHAVHFIAKNTSIEKYIKHGFLWRGHGSIETLHVMDCVAPLPKSEYLKLIQEPFFSGTSDKSAVLQMSPSSVQLVTAKLATREFWMVRFSPSGS